jgi:ABC-type nitrate/sulfonate/bicarbonate transport system permease component
MEKYKRLNKIEFLFFGLGIGYYFGEAANNEGYIYVFIFFIIMAVIGFVMDKRDIASRNEESISSKD